MLPSCFAGTVACEEQNPYFLTDSGQSCTNACAGQGGCNEAALSVRIQSYDYRRIWIPNDSNLIQVPYPQAVEVPSAMKIC